MKVHRRDKVAPKNIKVVGRKFFPYFCKTSQLVRSENREHKDLYNSPTNIFLAKKKKKKSSGSQKGSISAIKQHLQIHSFCGQSYLW